MAVCAHELTATAVAVRRTGVLYSSSANSSISSLFTYLFFESDISEKKSIEEKKSLIKSFFANKTLFFSKIIIFD